ncbi:hypothetical protein ACT29H_06045 [Thermophagus sp. OGC60D27]|uniref:hypothetical protein n=1 Tax=Thermophagus sp. OGC60D27 TaxID=3458415 RepID=UPI0040376DD6
MSLVVNLKVSNRESDTTHIQELIKKELSSNIVNAVNQSIEAINSFSGSKKDLLKQMEKEQSKILELIGEELKLAPKYYYPKMGMVIGMGRFAVFSGPVFGIS